MKLDVKSRTSTGVEFTAGGVSNQETGKVHWVLIRSGGLPNQTNPFFLFRAPVAPISADPVPAVVGGNIFSLFVAAAAPGPAKRGSGCRNTAA